AGARRDHPFSSFRRQVSAIRPDIPDLTPNCELKAAPPAPILLPYRAGASPMAKAVRKVAVVGAGKIGSTIAALLTPHYDVLVIDQNAGALAALDAHPAPKTAALAIDDAAALADA